ncbi:hypothetical protein BDP81DRAFT_23909 [Colletotrichum phormii]|uniref:Uncharacterized protein n=1 Tax=Colletotrichum phormii TaxID=359342 RepID=A0AAI9ZQU9_9PEZI|nr:uncharacterized protein BDP81DRAFT_23909 [Colletotrichum phormii]KAK1636515.1 hypothetical protein BDP81DRAFT_23909 [Colletotrichum phormii]
MAAPLFSMQPHTRKMRGQEISTERNHVPTHRRPSIWRRRSDGPTEKFKSMPVHRVVELHGLELRAATPTAPQFSIATAVSVRICKASLPPQACICSVAARKTRLAAKIFSHGFTAVPVPSQSSLGGQEKSTKRPTASAYPVMFYYRFSPLARLTALPRSD